MLGSDEIKRRIEAARTLRGVAQAELDRLFHADGLGKGEAGRVERGDLPMTRVRRDAFCRHLRVPARWFLSEDVDEVVGLYDAPATQPTDAALRRAAEILAPQLLAAAQALPQEPAQAPQGTDEPGHRPPGAEGADG